MYPDDPVTHTTLETSDFSMFFDFYTQNDVKRQDTLVVTHRNDLNSGEIHKRVVSVYLFLMWFAGVFSSSPENQPTEKQKKQSFEPKY